MDKKLKAYLAEAEKYLATPHKGGSENKKEAIEYHFRMLQHFQHERLVHLIVTFFFALFLVIFFLAFLFVSMNVDFKCGGEILPICLGLITAILGVTLIFYVRHYYLLENGVQKLQELTPKFYKKS